MNSCSFGGFAPRKCPGCGESVGSDDKFCVKCGAKVEAEASTPDEPTTPSPATSYEAPDYTRTKGGSSGLLISAVVFIAVFLVIGGLIYFAAKIGGGLVSEYDALNRLSAFGISSQSMYAENGFYWESGTSDFSPYFTGEDVNGYEFVYLADDFNDDGLDEAEAFVLMAIPKDTGSGSTAYYTDEYCRSFQAVVDTGHMRDELLSFSASDVEWDYDPNATEPRIRAFESLQSYTSSG